MGFDITEEFQLDLTSEGSSGIYQNSGVIYDFAFNSVPFLDATSRERPSVRQTAPYRKDQSDNSAEPGEQSLTGWWLRSQSSFHYGAGINFYEPAQEQGYAQNQTLRYMFADSEGVNVWREGDVTLLRDVTAGHIVTSALPTMMRSIRWSNTDGVLTLDNYDVDKVDTTGTETHFIDYNSGTDTPVYAICDDGTYAYWLTNKATGTKWTVLKKPLTGDSATAETTIYQVTGTEVATRGVIEYAKERLIVGMNHKLFEITVDASPVATELFVSPNTEFSFTGIAETPSDIYVSGYEGIRSTILRLVVQDDGTIPVLSGAVVAAEMPRGEIIHTISTYLGYMLIGTNRGVRVAQVESNGGLTYGPLLFESEQPVYQFAFADRFAWCTAKIHGDCGLIRIDLSTQIDALLFPYANDLQAVGVERECTGVAFLGKSDRLAFSSAHNVTNGNVYVENASTLRTSGYLTTGKIRFNTTEDKFFKFVKERAQYLGGYIVLSADGNSITIVDSVTGNQDIAIPGQSATEYKYFTFTLTRDSSDTSVGPVLNGYQIKALPATRKQRLMQYQLSCFDTERDRNNLTFGYKGRAFEMLSMFEDLEATGNTVRVQDFKTGETFIGLIEECTFVNTSTASRTDSGFGGYLTVTVRKI